VLCEKIDGSKILFYQDEKGGEIGSGTFL